MFRLDSEGWTHNISDPTETICPYDPTGVAPGSTAEAWYTATSVSGEPSWGDGIFLDVRGELGLAHSEPVKIAGELVGVISSHISIAGLSRFLKVPEMKLGITGESFIVEAATGNPNPTPYPKISIPGSPLKI